MTFCHLVFSMCPQNVRPRICLAFSNVTVAQFMSDEICHNVFWVPHKKQISSIDPLTGSLHPSMTCCVVQKEVGYTLETYFLLYNSKSKIFVLTKCGLLYACLCLSGFVTKVNISTFNLDFMRQKFNLATSNICH